jgi:hypothetical protein
MSEDVSDGQSLQSWLWEAANILRGPVDASDFKAYVFPLLFLKRISDIYDEERAEALAESGGDEESEESSPQVSAQVQAAQRCRLVRSGVWLHPSVLLTISRPRHGDDSSAFRCTVSVTKIGENPSEVV